MDNDNEKEFDDASTVSDADSSENIFRAEDDTDNTGEYHFTRPESRLYEDAGFVPSSEDTAVPEYFVPNKKEQKKKKKRDPMPSGWFMRMASIGLACAIIGGLLGGVATSKIIESNTEPIPQSAATSGTASNGTSGGTSNVTSTQSPTVLSSGGMSASDIYALGCKQSVGITTEVTTTNWFGQTSSTALSGSGFVVTADGYIITNYHVIEYAYEYDIPVSVMFYDGSAYEASIAGVEPENDIAVLKIDADGLSPITPGNSDNTQVGDIVYAIGNPLGELAFSMSTGSVSALDRSIKTGQNQPRINMMQIDAAVNEGNSGGPLYNANGEVIGVVSAKYESSGVEGLGFAIPINDAVSIANDLITKGYVTGKAYMGVSVDTRYNSVYADYYKLPVGAYVFNVEEGSCAEKCGICAGDIITMIDDHAISGFNDLESVMRYYKAGDSAVVTVYRQKDYIKLDIVFDESEPNSDDGNGVSRSGLLG